MDFDDSCDLDQPHKEVKGVPDSMEEALMGKDEVGDAAGGGGTRAAGSSGGGGSVDIAELLRNQFSAMKQDVQQMLHSNTIDMKREITTQVSAQVAPLASSVREIREVQESQAKQIREIQLQMSAQSNASEGGSLAGESTRAS
eukprot:4390763-Pyramimonas_sp.AAC.1